MIRQIVHPMPRKKLIEFGWDMVSPIYLRDNFLTMENRPFNGTTIRLPDDTGGGCVFDVDKWTQSDPIFRDRELKILSEIPRGKIFTDNFVTVYGASTMDWFSDSDWEKVLENIRFCAISARISHCKGICWDAEPYSGHNPWRYTEQPNYKKHTFFDTYLMVRKRGCDRARTDTFPAPIYSYSRSWLRGRSGAQRISSE